jgi:uncharacterized protein (TIGR00369 family)
LTDLTPFSQEELPPAATLLGRRLLGVDPESGKATLEFLAKPEFCNRHGTIQGGILAAMLDSAAGVVVTANLPSHLTAVTVQLNTSFVKPAPPGPLRAQASLVAMDDRSAEVTAEIGTPEGEVVARATANLRILRRK